MTIQEKFLVFHYQNPGVYKVLVRKARMLKVKGHRTSSIKMLFEVIRWNYYARSKTAKPMHLDNRFHSRYVRLIMEREPDLKGFFEIRSLKEV